ncbi:Hypothetical Protein SLY_0213 [Strawberry lethal yellows phytoplasma (CPA) str. NZSb11]|uniref:Uncharacterized protein n=1 Tax=Strawberry lethal yellows phytoplasma (CPA) str. NZSb11 TaxID=980422 RepID=R4RLB9_PHYAS|nr:Hypothetical Protein SLY_0213 [Strawberry lethal yellows phytoplasma (CPA) str. NZSb11]
MRYPTGSINSSFFFIFEKIISINSIHFFIFPFLFYFNLRFLTSSLRVFDSLKFTTVFAGIFSFLPVLGFRPLWAFLDFKMNLPIFGDIITSSFDLIASIKAFSNEL